MSGRPTARGCLAMGRKKNLCRSNLSRGESKSTMAEIKSRDGRQLKSPQKHTRDMNNFHARPRVAISSPTTQCIAQSFSSRLIILGDEQTWPPRKKTNHLSLARFPHLSCRSIPCPKERARLTEGNWDKRGYKDKEKPKPTRDQTISI
jgi:hypothetical protein